MEDQLYGRVAFERFIREPQLMNNLSKIQKKLEPRFCGIRFLEFKDICDSHGLKILLEYNERFIELKNALKPSGAYYTFDEDQWSRFGDFLSGQGGALAMYCRSWFPWAQHVYQSCKDCKNVTNESRPINRYKTFRDDIKNRFRCSSCLCYPAFNTHFPGTYSGFFERSADTEELSFIWSFVKHGGANIFGLHLIDIPFRAEEW